MTCTLSGPPAEASSRKLHTTALLRSLGRKEHAGYFSSATSACKKAEEYAQVNCTRFFQFQYAWPELVTSLEGDKGLSELFLAEIADLKEEAAQREVQEMGIEEEAIESLGSAEQIAARWGNRAGHAGKPTPDADRRPLPRDSPERMPQDEYGPRGFAALGLEGFSLQWRYLRYGPEW